MNARNLIGWAVAIAGVALLAATGFLVVTRGDRQPAAAEGMAEMDMQGMDMEDGVVRVDAETARSLGVTLVTAELASVHRQIRTTGHVTYDETRLATITPKFDGFVERLYVDFTGQRVRRGQPLLEIYSPELVSAQEELLAAARLERQLARSAAPGVAQRTAGLVESARRRLLLWDISPAQIEAVERTGEVRRTLTMHAPFSGFVVEKPVSSGQAVRAGEVMYRLADLTTVWVEADVYENDLRFVRIGDAVEIGIDAYPGETVGGRVSYIYPDVRPDTRTARLRVELPNQDGSLKPGMFAAVHLDAPVAERAVMVPRDAVMRTGVRDVVFVEVEPGAYEAREVRIGADSDGRTQVVSGLLAGERIVARANFMLDAESRLMETMMGQPGMPGMDMDMGDMDMPGADMESPRMEMDMPGARAPGSGADAPGTHLDTHERAGPGRAGP